MSLTSKQIDELRAYAKDKKGELAKLINDAADTIEMLSAKLHASQMERSSQYYHGGWIPCSERLPEDGTECLVSVRCSKKVVVVDMATYSTDLFKVDKEDFFGNRGESGWYYLSGEYGYCKMLNVIAWMPLPESYSGE